MENLFYLIIGIIAQFALIVALVGLYYCSKKGKKKWVIGICIFLLLYFTAGPMVLLMDYLERDKQRNVLPELFREKLLQPPMALFTEKCRGKFVYYDLNEKRFDTWAYGSKYHSLDPDEITVIVFYREDKKFVGNYRNSRTGEYVTDAYQGYVDVRVVDVKTWSIIAQKTFEAESPPVKLESFNDRSTRTDVSTGKVRDYIDGLFEN